MTSKKKKGPSSKNPTDDINGGDFDYLSELKTRQLGIMKYPRGAIIGKGSFGKMHISKNESIDDVQVTKTIKGHFSQSDDEKKKYIANELKISEYLINKSIPGLVKIISIHPNRSRVVMRFGGIPLMDGLNYLIIDRAMVRHFLITMTQASLSLLECGLIHRDISLRNILVLVEEQKGPNNKLFNGVTMCLSDVGLCSFNVNGTRGFQRNTGNAESLVTWRTDIYHIGLCAKELMNKTVSSVINAKTKAEKIKKMFGPILEISNNMMSDDPLIRPDHHDVLKSLFFMDGDEEYNNFKMIPKKNSEIEIISEDELRND